MENLELFIFARALHIAAIVIWIGGVAFVTLVLIPSLQNIEPSNDRLNLFELLEGRFALLAKAATLVTGLSGLYMLNILEAWSRYLMWQYWWLHLMTFIWGIFTLVLFVLEPLVLHRWFKQQAKNNSDKAFSNLLLMHRILLSLSLIAIIGAMLGAHGYRF